MPVTVPVIPAKAGTSRRRSVSSRPEAPAFAGVTRVARASAAPALLALLLLAGCATQTGAAVEPAAPGFLWGLWHGFIFPFAWILSLFMPDVAVYAVPNNGGWYDFGYFIGIVFLGAGAWGARRRR
jgi:hypothetical protein